MKKNLKLWFAVCLLVVISQSIVAAQEASGDEDQEAGEPQASQEEQAAELFNQVREQINQGTESLRDAANNINVIEEGLKEATEATKTLQEQIQLLEEEIDFTQKKIDNAQAAADKLKERIDETRALIEEKEAELAAQKALIADWLRFLHAQNVNMGSFDTSLSQTLKLLFSDDSASDQLEELYFLELLEMTSRDLFDQLQVIKADLEETALDLKKQKKEEDAIVLELSTQKNILEIQKKAQVDLLEQTQGKEEIYKTLLEQAKAERNQIQSELKDLGANYDSLKEQLNSIGSHLSTGKLGPSIGDNKLSWPVKPDRGVSAFFRDSSYKAALGRDHNAIDIRAPQNSSVRAAADGVVYRLRGGDDLKYHYIIIAHRDGILTLYGHMYDIFVKEGQVVLAGQEIGRSGGLPGSRGAGYLTTGPHLHFEVLANNQHVDPLIYLDLSQISEKYLPDEYLDLRR